jgi:hypothetical protein
MTTPEAISARKQRRVQPIDPSASLTLGDIETSEPRIPVDQVNDNREEGTTGAPQLPVHELSSTQTQSSLQQEDVSVVVEPVSCIDEHLQNDPPFPFSTWREVYGDGFFGSYPRTSPSVISRAKSNHEHIPRRPNTRPYPTLIGGAQSSYESGDIVLLPAVSYPFLIQAILVCLTWD